MSAAFKNAKKKLSQTELRRLMTEHKNKKDVKPITSPLAKFNENGQLTCVLCKSVVRSAAVWPVHINSKQHRDNVDAAKKLKEKTNNFTTSKRSLSPQPETQPKKLKSILKKPGGASSSDVEPEPTPQEIVNNGQKSSLPTDFFDSKTTKNTASSESGIKSAVTAKIDKGKTKDAALADQSGQEEVLPEGFFDDPKLDAKARNQEYKDPIEEEWDKFQKAIREADDESAAIIAEDQDEATAERQIDEIDEQIKHLSKVLVLEKKKQEITVTSNSKTIENDEDSDVDEKDFDEFLDWRSKQSFK